ncbi:hypothetical protein [Arthrobacter oryzae]|uniref:hypothetical protein n=1 Tax=Arthrobacter oryzae TaxID=409290 RepID=UPI00278199BB|nr:hypothetical protein [Arthrobacter oryzae]MDQ0078260.1 hypothetical protein [Arthrobacter oryzae]
MELDAGSLGQGQQLAAEVNQVVGIGLLDILEPCQVGTEIPDDVTLLGVLGFEPVDVYSLRSELVAEGFLVLHAASESGSQLGPRLAVGDDRAGLGNGIPELNGRGGIRA